MAFGPPFPRSDGYPVGEQLPPITPQNYQYEAERRRTFLGWSSNRVSPEKLARAGFVYTKEGDKVKCFKCGVTRSSWQQDDIPFNVHQQLNPCCPFLQTFVCKRKPLCSEMVLCSNAPAWQRKIRWNTSTSVHQLYRGTTLQLDHFNGAQSVVRSFPGCSPVDHNPTRGLVEDDNTIHHPGHDVMMPPVQPSPAQLPPPVQSTQSFDHSAVLIGDVSKPLQTHHAAGICKDPIHTKTNVTVDDNAQSMNNDDNVRLKIGVLDNVEIFIYHFFIIGAKPRDGSRQHLQDLHEWSD